jgi:hypothetical protein
MAQVVADRRDVDFVLHEQLQVESLSKYEEFVMIKVQYDLPAGQLHFYRSGRLFFF